MKETLTGLFHERQGGHSIPSNAANQGHSGRAQATPQVTAPIHKAPPTPALENNEPHENICKILYPSQPTTSDALHAELLRSNPSLGAMLVARPRMFTSKVALLTFLSGARLPATVGAFGEVLRLREYVDRRKLRADGAAEEAGGGRGWENATRGRRMRRGLGRY